jgi:hypothetical protein
MWKHVATTLETNTCEQLHTSRSQDNTFAADDLKIPDQPRNSNDPAPAPADGDAPAVEGEADPTAADHAADRDEGATMPETHVFADVGTQTEVDDEREEVEAGENPAAAVQQEDRPVNNTNFAYMAAAAQMNARLPPMSEGNLDGARKRKLLEAGLGDPERERTGKRWHGAHFLGQGATGSCSLWLRTDRDDNIDEVSDDTNGMRDH